MPDAESNGLMYAIALHQSQTSLNALGSRPGPGRHGQGGRYKPKGHYTRTRYFGLANPSLSPLVVE